MNRVENGLPLRFIQAVLKTLLVTIMFVSGAYADSLKCPCKVINVLTGDTLFVQDQYHSSRKIWLAGIDAPPMNERVGMQSRQNLIQLVANRHVEVEFKERDRYGRIEGKLISGTQDINLQQISQGWARYYKKRENELSRADRSLYQQAEEKARQQRKGLWKDQKK